MDYFELLEEAWKLSDSVREYLAKSGRQVEPEEVWRNVFAVSPLVDPDRSLRESGLPPLRVFLKSPYGLAYRAETRDWIPFRHGDISIPSTF